jgi:hypothetical protein
MLSLKNKYLYQESRMNLRDEIARVAYDLYVKSGCIQGREFENWIEAERIVMAGQAEQETEKPEKEIPAREPVMSEKDGTSAKKKIRAGSAKISGTAKKGSEVKKETGEIKKKRAVKKKD